MLLCRACNTRYAKGSRVCPSCGRKATASGADSASGDSGPLPLSRAKAGAPRVDLELDEDAVLGDSSSGRVPERRAREAKRPAPAPAPTAAPAAAAPAPGSIDAGLGQVKALLGEHPGLLEKGLGVYADEDGEPLGVDFATPVGSIDLLCRDRKGGFVVVHLPEPEEVAESLSAMLRRMGWVRKHLAEERDEVRGVVVLEQLPEELAYAAAGVAGAIAFKGFKLALSFHDLEG